MSKHSVREVVEEVRELRRANELSNKASAYLAAGAGPLGPSVAERS